MITKGLKLFLVSIFLNWISFSYIHSQELFQQKHEIYKKLKCIAKKEDGTLCLEKTTYESLYCTYHYIKNYDALYKTENNITSQESNENDVTNELVNDKKSIKKTTLLKDLFKKSQENPNLPTITLVKRNVNSSNNYEISEDNTYTPKYETYTSEGYPIEESSNNEYTGIIVLGVLILVTLAIVIYINKPKFTEHKDLKEDVEKNKDNNKLKGV